MKTMKFYNLIFASALALAAITLLSYTDFSRGGLMLTIFVDLIWNMVPIGAFYFMFRKGFPYLKSKLLIFMLGLSGLALFVVPVLFFLEMLFQRMFGGGSSTSGVGFIFIPLYALLLGLIPGTRYLLKLEKIINSEE